VSHLALIITGLIVAALLHVANAAAGAMLAPLPGQERTRYGYWFRFVQKLASNSGQLEAALPAIARELAAEEHRAGIIHVAAPAPHQALELAPATLTQETIMSTTTTPATAAASTAKHSFFVTAILAVAHLFVNVFKGIFSTDQGKQIEAGIVAFVKTDVGQLAVDAVQYASTIGGGQTNDQLRAAAVAKLKQDLVTAGKDLTAFGESVLNLFIEMAFTYVQGTVAALPAAIA
jgi:hypothetical protein